jgi:hypothetical protein
MLQFLVGSRGSTLEVSSGNRKAAALLRALPFYELRQGICARFLQHGCQGSVAPKSGKEVNAVRFPQRAYKCVAALLSDFSVLVSGPPVQGALSHRCPLVYALAVRAGRVGLSYHRLRGDSNVRWIDPGKDMTTVDGDSAQCRIRTR